MVQENHMIGIVRAVCTSPAKGTEKRPVSQGLFIKTSESKMTLMQANGTGR
jgi:hypothetical protein